MCGIAGDGHVFATSSDTEVLRHLYEEEGPECVQRGEPVFGRLLDNRPLALQLGQAARRLIQDRFSVDRMVRSTGDLYTELLARKQRTPLPRTA